MSFEPLLTVAVHSPPAAVRLAPLTVTRVTPTLSPATTERTFGPVGLVSVPSQPTIAPSMANFTIDGLVRSVKGVFCMRIHNTKQLKKNVSLCPSQSFRFYSEALI